MNRSLISCFIAISLASATWAEDPISFSRQIRPILSENCFFCHGPDGAHREGGLRLDQEAGAMTVVTPGNSQESALMERLRTDDADLKMPPPSSHRTLTPEQIALIGKWIDAGATWGEHWSFAPLTSPSIPTVELKNEAATARPQNPIDAFVQDRLLRTPDLPPSPVADRRTLIRRLTLDLTGLPATSDEVNRFLNDRRPDAVDRLIDRLLASPSFGQRMAWDWLDAARYADTNGYQGDNERTMWPWRDWVIDSLNESMPYDKFTRWQIGGDLLPDAPPEARLATGFCRNHPINGEGGRIAEENRVDYVMDMAETVGTVWLGLTFNCCRCHDHKYDPLTQKNYYQLTAFFNQTPVNGGGGNPQTPPVIDWPSESQKRELDAQNERVRLARRNLEARQKSLAELQSQWEEGWSKSQPNSQSWQPLQVTHMKAEHQQLALQPSGAILASGENPVNDTYEILATTNLPSIASIRLEALRHPTMTAGGLARSDSGNFVLTEFEVFLEHPGDSAAVPLKSVPLKIAAAEATFEQGDFRIAKTFDGNPKTGWAVHEGRPVDREHAAVFRLEATTAIPQGSHLKLVLKHDSPHTHHNLGHFQIFASDRNDAPLQDSSQALRTAISVRQAERNDDQKKLVTEAHRNTDADYLRFATEFKQAEESLASLRKAIPKVMVMEDMPQPRPTHVLGRGLYTELGEKVLPNIPESLPKFAEGLPANRLGFAEWLTSVQQPLTARVAVNRIWQQFFGVGLVKTAEDFGVQAEIPVYGELLDYLAAAYRDQGWDTKQLVRWIVSSHTYQQSSKLSASAHQIDPDNRLLARGPRYRLPAWMLRDQALAAAGLLVHEFSGPSVNVYQPEGVWEEASFGKKVYRQDQGASLYRRSLYIFWRRIASPTMFFDNASRMICEVKTVRTNTPLHALMTMNDTAFVEAARVLAERALRRPNAAPQDRVQFVFSQVLARHAQATETSLLLASLARSTAYFTDQPQQAQRLVSVGESPRDESLPPAELAAWTSLCLAVLNLDEALSKE